jgi:hypothetical protein
MFVFFSWRLEINEMKHRKNKFTQKGQDRGDADTILLVVVLISSGCGIEIKIEIEIAELNKYTIKIACL